MLYGEYRGVQEMDQTLTIRVPRPITFGEYRNTNKGGLAFVVFEYLEFTHGGDEFELGKQLAMVSDLYILCTAGYYVLQQFLMILYLCHWIRF
jgi:fructosamine-3-kinase